MLELCSFPTLSTQPKDGSTNIEALKIKINEFYREMKSRNQVTKGSLTTYYAKYYGEGSDPKQKEYVEK